MATREIPLITIENLDWYEVFPNEPETVTTEGLDDISPKTYKGGLIHLNHPIPDEPYERIALMLVNDAENKLNHRNAHEIAAIRCNVTARRLISALYEIPEFWHGLRWIDVHLVYKKAGEYDKLPMEDIFIEQIPPLTLSPVEGSRSQSWRQVGKTRIKMSLKLTVGRDSQLSTCEYINCMEAMHNLASLGFTMEELWRDNYDRIMANRKLKKVDVAEYILLNSRCDLNEVEEIYNLCSSDYFRETGKIFAEGSADFYLGHYAGNRSLPSLHARIFHSEDGWKKLKIINSYITLLKRNSS